MPIMVGESTDCGISAASAVVPNHKMSCGLSIDAVTVCVINDDDDDGSIVDMCCNPDTNIISTHKMSATKDRK